MQRTWSITVPVLSWLVVVACGGGSNSTPDAGSDTGSVTPDAGQDAIGEASTSACPAQAEVTSGSACSGASTGCPSSASTECPGGAQTGPFCACSGGSWVCDKTITACPDAGAGDADAGKGSGATWTFKGGTATASFSSGQSATVTVGGAGDTPGSIAFTFAAASASASVTFTTAGTLMDVSPSTLPADDAPSQSMFMGAVNNPILYVSIDNAGASALSFAMTPAVVLTGALAQSTEGDVECQLDWYAAMGGTPAWRELPGADVMLSGTGAVTSLSIPAAGPPGGGTFNLPPGQTVVAISCD